MRQPYRPDQTYASFVKNAGFSGTHIRPEDYNPSDMMKHNMGYRSKDQLVCITKYFLHQLSEAFSGKLICMFSIHFKVLT